MSISERSCNRSPSPHVLNTSTKPKAFATEHDSNIEIEFTGKQWRPHLVTHAFLLLHCQRQVVTTALESGYSDTRFTSFSCSCSPLILSSSILCSSCTSLIRSFKSWFSNSNSLKSKLKNTIKTTTTTSHTHWEN